MNQEQTQEPGFKAKEFAEAIGPAVLQGVQDGLKGRSGTKDKLANWGEAIKMAITEINEMFVRSKDLSKVHRVEVEVHFTAPVTYSEAEEAVTYAISGYLFSRGHVDESNNEEEDTP